MYDRDDLQYHGDAGASEEGLTRKPRQVHDECVCCGDEGTVSRHGLCWECAEEHVDAEYYADEG
ncbi:MAG: hypothetical protein JRC86_00545 [Deltaproteobacteria bacterium]|nr:hypothetical protein [Deltaproteobacteria bacterium]